MAYQFPTISNIDEVLPYVEGREDFLVGQGKSEFILVDYNTVLTDTFKSEDPHEAAILRECRGLLFHMDGTVARRAYHKFFNLNETEETSLGRISELQVATILEKLDGSMVAPFVWPTTGDIYWASMRGSRSYHTMLAGQYDGSRQAKLVHAAHKAGLTAVFEYCAPDNRIIIHYESPQLILTALRNRLTGEYKTYAQVCAWAEDFGVPVVSLMEVHDTDLPDLIDHVWNMDDAEGCVIRFDDGTLVKLKGEWYTQLHKLLSYFEFEKDIAWLVLSGKEDDLLGILSDEKRNSLETYRDELRSSILAVAGNLEHWRNRVMTEEIDRKSFATAKNGPVGAVKFLIFKSWDNLESIEAVEDVTKAALASTNRGSKWDAFKQGNGMKVVWAPPQED